MPRGVPNESFESRFWKRVLKTRGCWIVRQIRSLEGTMSQAALAKKFGMGQSQISRILRRLCWRHVS